MARAWPLPALAAWSVAWAVQLALAPLAGPLAAGLAATGAGVAVAPLLARVPWRRAIVALGFPLSLLAVGVASPWLWLLPLGALALVYPLGAWRDAPLFPTPAGALAGLGAAVLLPDGARILDAGCGAGDALVALAAEYPRATLAGVERSGPVALAARLRLRGRARVARGDLWAGDWSSLDLLYVFQRPESMPRIADKAIREMRGDGLVASLEFPIVGARPTFSGQGARTLFVYRVRDLGPRPLGSAGRAGREGHRPPPTARGGERASRDGRRAPLPARAGRRRSAAPRVAVP